jgi:hypothetical protein
MYMQNKARSLIVLQTKNNRVECDPRKRGQSLDSRQ